MRPVTRSAHLVLVLVLGAPLGARAGDPVDSTLVLSPSEATLAGCDCFAGTASLTIAAGIRRGDVMITFDLTGSMAQERQVLVDNIVEITDRLAARIPDLRMGLASYRDYPGNYSSCGYSTAYGDSISYPYELHQPLTDDLTELHAAAAALPPAIAGSDLPEAYSRAFSEVVNDPLVGWEPGRRNVVLNFGDSVPHDCVLFECFGIFDPWSFGVDPGPDETAETADDLKILEVLDQFEALRTVLIHLDSSGDTPLPFPIPLTISDLWHCWTARTGGESVEIGADGTIPSHDSLADLIEELLEAQEVECPIAELVVEAGYEEWLVEGAFAEEDLALPAERDVPFSICVPEGVGPGIHEFELELRCGGETLATATVRVEVTIGCEEGCGDVVPPELVPGVLPDCHETEAEAVAAALAATEAPFEDGELTWEVEVLGRCPARLIVTARDECLNESAVEYETTIDGEPPAFDGVPADATVECDAVPPPALPSVTDDCDPAPATGFSETRTDGDCPGEYQLLREWTAIDACGHASSARQLVEVVDTTPPVIEASGEDEHCLWPPNHRFVRFELSDFAPVLSDACSGPVEWRFEGCASSQPDDGLGDGHTERDCRVAPDGRSFLVRAERLGNEKEPRRYAVLAIATDACGNESEPVEIGGITVPHDQREHPGPCRSGDAGR